MTQEMAEARTPEQRIQEATNFIIGYLVEANRGHVKLVHPDYKLLIYTDLYSRYVYETDKPPQLPLAEREIIYVLKGTPGFDTTREKIHLIANRQNLTELVLIRGDGSVGIVPYKKQMLVSSEFGIVLPVSVVRPYQWESNPYWISDPDKKAEFLEKIIEFAKNAHHGSAPA